MKYCKTITVTAEAYQLSKEKFEDAPQWVQKYIFLEMSAVAPHLTFGNWVVKEDTYTPAYIMSNEDFTNMWKIKEKEK